MQSVDAHTEYGTYRSKFPRLKVLTYDINEIWSMDLAFVDKLAKYNRGVKYLMVAVDVLSRYVRVEPLKTKDAKDVSKAFKKMIKNKQPQKVWTDKGTEFKGDFKKLCDKRGIEIYHTESETKSAFAKRNIRSLKNIIYKYLELKWTYSYIDQLQEFVKTINGRVNRITKVAPNKVTKKDVPRLVSLTVISDSKLKLPRLKPGDLVRIAKKDLPFRKRYKRTYTDEVFENFKVATLSPPTNNLIDANKEEIKGKFYEQGLRRVDTL